MKAFDSLCSGPVYELLEAELRTNILNGMLAPGSKLCSEDDLARQYGISRGSVRTALEHLAKNALVVKVKGSGTFVTQLSERIPAPVYNHTVVFLSLATALSSEAFYGSGNYAPFLHGLSEGCDRAGYNLLMAHVDSDWQPPPCLARKDIAGIIFHGPVQVDFYRQYIQPWPNISLQYPHPEIDGFCVQSDFQSKALQAVGLLRQAGRQRIGYISNEIEMYIPRMCFHSFRFAMETLGMDFDPRYCAVWQRPFTKDNVLEIEHTVSDYLPWLEPMFNTPGLKAPDAFVCGDDWRAYNAIKALKKLGLRVPEDISIIGSRNGPDTSGVPYSISGIDSRLSDICNHGVWLLHEVLSGRVSKGLTLLIRPRVIDGITLVSRS